MRDGCGVCGITCGASAADGRRRNAAAHIATVEFRVSTTSAPLFDAVRATSGADRRLAAPSKYFRRSCAV